MPISERAQALHDAAGKLEGGAPGGRAADADVMEAFGFEVQRMRGDNGRRIAWMYRGESPALIYQPGANWNALPHPSNDFGAAHRLMPPDLQRVEYGRYDDGSWWASASFANGHSIENEFPDAKGPEQALCAVACRAWARRL